MNEILTQANSTSIIRVNNGDKWLVFKVLGAQLVVGVIASLAWWCFNPQAWASALCGGIVIVVPSMMMAWGLRLLNPHQRSPSWGLGRWVIWEIIKLAFSISLMVIALRQVQNLNGWAFMSTLVLTLQMYWLAPLLIRKRYLNN